MTTPFIRSHAPWVAHAPWVYLCWAFVFSPTGLHSAGSCHWLAVSSMSPWCAGVQQDAGPTHEKRSKWGRGGQPATGNETSKPALPTNQTTVSPTKHQSEHCKHLFWVIVVIWLAICVCDVTPCLLLLQYFFSHISDVNFSNMEERMYTPYLIRLPFIKKTRGRWSNCFS